MFVIPSASEGSHQCSLSTQTKSVSILVFVRSSSSMRLGMTRDEREIFNSAVWKPPSLGSIVPRDRCDTAQTATDRLRRAHGPVDPDSLRHRCFHLSDRAGGSGFSALGTGSERSHSRKR